MRFVSGLLVAVTLFLSSISAAWAAFGGEELPTGEERVVEPAAQPPDSCPVDPEKSEPGFCGCGVSDSDSDADGHADCEDLCPSDPSKTAPGVCDCGASDADSDWDSVADCIDGCPADISKVAPGECGCGFSDLDSDGDGAPDCEDNCPVDAEKRTFGVCGCAVPETDSDSDGYADCVDLCPLDPSKTAPGACNCGTPDTDSDFDGLPDCLDVCSTDGSKLIPGECGCGILDTDSDADGIPDCNDACSLDPLKTAPGVCSCGVLEVDTDGDNTPDCHDLCPSDAAKVDPLACGCGVSDSDSQGDGIPDCLEAPSVDDDDGSDLVDGESSNDPGGDLVSVGDSVVNSAAEISCSTHGPMTIEADAIYEPYDGSDGSAKEGCDPAVPPGCSAESVESPGEPALFDLQGYFVSNRNSLGAHNPDGAYAAFLGCDDGSENYPCQVSDPETGDQWTLQGPQNIGAQFFGVGITSLKFRWPNGEILFRILEGEKADEFKFGEAAKIKTAIFEFNQKLAPYVKFINADAKGKAETVPPLVISKGVDCEASVGYREGNEHKVTLNALCIESKVWIHHELMHVVGLRHEQERFDRDDYICVWDGKDPRANPNLEKTPPDHIVASLNILNPDNSVRAKAQFEKSPAPNWTDYLEYNPFSIMHYNDTLFCKEPGPGTTVWEVGIPGNKKPNGCMGPTMSLFTPEEKRCSFPSTQADRLTGPIKLLDTDIETVKLMYRAWDWRLAVKTTAEGSALETFATREAAAAKCATEGRPDKPHRLPKAAELSENILEWFGKANTLPFAKGSSSKCIWVDDQAGTEEVKEDQMYFWKLGQEGKWQTIPAGKSYRAPECYLVCVRG